MITAVDLKDSALELAEQFGVDYTVNSGDDEVLSMVERSDGIDDARVVGRGVGKRLFEFVVTWSCVTTTLADAGAIAQRITAEAGTGTVSAIVPEHQGVRAVVEIVREHHSPADLVARHETDRVAPSRHKIRRTGRVDDHRTDRQREALRTAYRSGYFEWPRAISADDRANRLEISQPTFSQHLRVAQERIFDAMFETRNSNV